MRRGLLVLLLLLVLPSVARATGPQTFPYGGTGSGAPADATYVTQTPNATLTTNTAIQGLITGSVNWSTAPTVTVSLNSYSPYTNDTLTATATVSDVDGNPVTLTYVWKVNGTVKQTHANVTSSTKGRCGSRFDRS